MSHQRLTVGNWSLSSVKDGELIIQNSDGQQQATILREDLPGFLFESNRGTKHTFTAETALGPELAAGWAPVGSGCGHGGAGGKRGGRVGLGSGRFRSQVTDPTCHPISPQFLCCWFSDISPSPFLCFVSGGSDQTKSACSSSRNLSALFPSGSGSTSWRSCPSCGHCWYVSLSNGKLIHFKLMSFSCIARQFISNGVARLRRTTAMKRAAVRNSTANSVPGGISSVRLSTTSGACLKKIPPCRHSNCRVRVWFRPYTVSYHLPDSTITFKAPEEATGCFASELPSLKNVSSRIIGMDSIQMGQPPASSVNL